MNHISCPDCGKSLSFKSKYCTCGWCSSEIQKPANHIADHRCVYTYSGQRCPFPGTISPSTHASALWYCLDHYQNLNDPKRSREILMEAEKNFESVMEDRIHWTIKLIPEEYQKIKRSIRELYLKHFRK